MSTQVAAFLKSLILCVCLCVCVCVWGGGGGGEEGGIYPGVYIRKLLGFSKLSMRGGMNIFSDMKKLWPSFLGFHKTVGLLF